MNFDQDPTLSADSPYEETHVPFLPRPSDSPQQPVSQPSVTPAARMTPDMPNSTGENVRTRGVVPSSTPPYPPSTHLPPPKSTQRRWGIWVLIIVLVVVAIYGGIRGVISATNVIHVMPQVPATAQVPLTVTATSTVENPYTHSGTLFFSDPLRDNSLGNGWDEASSQYGSCAFTGGAYHVSTPSTNGGVHCAARQDFSNFTFEVQMTIIKGDSGGVDFRLDSEQNTRYVFYVEQNGTYELVRAKGVTNPTILFNITFSSAIHQGLGQTNVIAVVAQGSQFTLYVNRTLVARATDNTYTHGQIALLAAARVTNGQPTEVVYTNAKLWTL